MIEEERIGAILALTLNRPEKSNALNLEMMDVLLSGLGRAKKEESIRCVLIRAKGKNFCAGRDLSLTGEKPSVDFIMRFDDAYTSIFQSIRRLPKPVIAAVHGYAAGGGFSLAMGCDFLVVHSDAQFGCFEMKQGFPAAINIALLSHHLGRRKALEIAMSGEPVSAATMRELGLVNAFVEGDRDFDQAATEFGQKIASLDPVGVRLTKETLYAVEDAHLEDALITGRQLNMWLASSGIIGAAGKRRTKGKS